MRNTNPYHRTTMPDLPHQLQQQYGAALGTSIFREACRLLFEELKRIHVHTDKAVKRHLSMGILPSAACYQALLRRNITRDDALRFVTERIFDATRKTARQMGHLCGWMSFPLFRCALRFMMATGYPPAGWDIVWQQSTATDIAFAMRSCLYLETFHRMGCPELCTAYCDADHILFAALVPRVRFARAGTLAQGHACCDFTFTKKCENRPMV